MKATIKIAMDNEAFSPCYGPELARILRDLAERMEADADPDADKTRCPIRDHNGNTVGELVIRK